MAFGEMSMLLGLPPRDKSFRGWLRPLIIPMALFTGILVTVGVLNSTLGGGTILMDGANYTGAAAVLRIVVAAPFFFIAFLVLATTICWLDSRFRSWRRRISDGAGNSHRAGQ